MFRWLARRLAREFSDSQSLLKILVGTGSGGEPYATHATVSRCIDILADASIDGTPTVYTGDREDPTPVEDGEWARLFAKPHPQLTRREWFRLLWVYRYQGGELGVVLEGRGDEPLRHDEVPAEMWVLPGSCFQEEVDPRTQLVIEWKVTTSAGTVFYPYDQVIWYRRPDPSKPIRGISELGSARMAYEGDVAAQRYQKAFYENGAVLSGVLSSSAPNVSQNQRREMRQSWEERHAGVDKAFRTAVLWGGMTYHATGLSQREAEFLESRRFNRDEIAMVYGVHKVLLGDTDQVNRATSQEAKRILWENKVLPTLKLVEDLFYAQLFEQRGASDHWLGFDLANVSALKDDLTGKVLNAKGLVDLGYPLNEVNARLEMGMEEQPWGDKGLLPFGLVPADEAAQGFDLGDDPALEDAGETDDQVGKEGESSDLPEGWRDRSGVVDERSDEAYYRSFERKVLNPGEMRFRRTFKSYFFGRRREVMAWLGQQRGVRELTIFDVDAFLTNSRERWDDVLKGKASPVYDYCASASLNEVAAVAGKVEPTVEQTAQLQEFLRTKTQAVTRVNETMIKHLRYQLMQGMADGENITELQDRVRKTFNAENARSLTIARTESAQTANGTRFMDFERRNVERIQWVSSNDNATRDAHLALHGQVVEMGQSFLPGMTLRHPGDTSGPAGQTINCRCAFRPYRAKQAKGAA